MRIARRRSSGQAALRHPVLACGLALAVLALAVVPASADRVALRNGTTLDGAVVVDAKTRTIVVTSTRGGMQVKDKVPFASALAVETPDRKLAWVASEQDLVEASDVLWVAAERVRYLEWCDAALKAGDGPRAARFLAAAEKRGATGYIVQQRRQKAAVVKPPAAQSAAAAEAAAKAAQAVDAEEAALPKAQAALLWSRLEGSWAGLPEARRIALGERILALDPAHGPVKAWFVSLVPEAYRARFGWKEWGTWKRVLGASGTLRYPPPLDAPARGLTPTEKELARAASIWKKDVVGVVRDGLVLIARPPAGPGLVRAATTSAAVFAFLETLFHTPTPKYKDSELVTVWVHSDRNDLWSHLSPVEEAWADRHMRHANGKHRERSAFFSPNEGLTKIFSPDEPDSAAREAEIRQDLAYFTTYHWLYVRCPRFRWLDTGTSEKAPGCFIESNLVDAVCGGGVDPATGAWTLLTRTGTAFESFKELKRTGQALAWESVLDASGADLMKLLEGATKQGEAGLRRALAWFVQAELATHWFLHGADAGMRGAFVDQVTDYFLGRAEGRTVKAVYGLDAAELGRRIDAWATK